MPHFAVVNSDNVVENIVVWDGASLWSPPEGRILVSSEGKPCSIGWLHSNGEFSDPNPPKEEAATPPAQ